MHRLVGQVVDAEGHAVVGASVWIESNAVTSDRDGGFAIENLLERSYEVRAQAGDLIGSRVIRVTAHSEPLVIELNEERHVMVTVVDASRVPIANAALRVIGSDHVVATDAKGRARITTHPREGELEITAAGYAPRRVSVADTIVLREGFAVSGRVVSDAGAPIANARVCARSDMGLDQAGVITDHAGAFTIPSAVGLHYFFVTDGEHAPTRCGPIDVDRVIADLEIAMKPGRVYAGHVVDAGGKPVARARVCLDTLSSSSSSRRWFFATSDLNGAFEIRGLPHTIGITGAEDDVAVVCAASADVVSDDVIVEPSGGQVLVVRRIDTSGVAGVVVDDTGAPVANVVVNAVARERLPLPEGLLKAKMMQDFPTIATSTRANARGEFSVRDLPVGEYGIWAGAFFPSPNSGLPKLFAAGIDSPAIASVMTGNTEVQLVRPRPSRITGTVTYADTGELVENFEVDLFAGYEIVTGLPGEHGAFDLRELKPGSYGVCIRRGLLAAPRVNVEIEAGASCDVGTIILERGRTLTGTVVDSAGRTVAGASVMLRDYGLFGNIGRFDATLDPSCALTDAAGAFAIAEIPTASSRIVVGADHPAYGRSLAVAAREPITLTLLECGSIAGTVTRGTQPLRGSVDAGSPPLAIAVTDKDGAFVMPRLPVGPVSLRVQIFADHSDGVYETTVVVEAGTRTAIAIDVPAGTVDLSVVMTPAPPGASLYLFRGTVAFRTYPELMAQFVASIHGRADWTGDAVPTFERLVPGEYTVCVMPLAGSPRDPQTMQQVHRDRASMKVYSTPVRVLAGPAEQTIGVELPG